MSLLKKLNDAPQHPDITEALEAYVTADKALDKAREAFEKAERLAAQREADLEAVIDREIAVRDDQPPAPRAAGEKES